MVLFILRGIFILIAASVATLYVLPFQEEQQEQVSFLQVVLMLGGTVLLVSLVVTIDAVLKQKRLWAVSGVFLGLGAGMLAAYALSFVVDLIGLMTAPDLPFAAPITNADYMALSSAHQDLLMHREAYLKLLEGVKVIIGLITCYVGISLVLQTKDDFRFVIPYVEFSKQIRGNRPLILDTSVIIDGRIMDVIETRLIQGTLVIPKFILNELQGVADSPDKLKRARGRRGLDILQKLQKNSHVEVVIDEMEVTGANVDQKLISLSHELKGRIMTNDFNLNKVAQLRGIEVVNINDVARSLRPVVLPGEIMTVALVKPGESPNQGVGYLEDGTMVVVEEGRRYVGRNVNITVTSSLQTSAGRMIFGRHEGVADHGPVSMTEDSSGEQAT